MMKTEASTNGEKSLEVKEHRRFDAADNHEQKNSTCSDGAGDSSGTDKKRSLFQRPSVILATAALVIAGIGYGAFAMFHSFTHETTDDAFIDVHFVSVAPKIAGRVAVVHVDDNQLVKKGDVLVEIDPRDFQVALAQAKANLAKDKAAQIQADVNEKRAQDLFTKKVMSAQERDTNVAAADSSKASVQADEAAVEQAELNLGYTKITASIASRTGAHVAGAAASLGHRQFQGNATARYAARATCDHFCGCLRGTEITGPCGQHSGR